MSIWSALYYSSKIVMSCLVRAKENSMKEESLEEINQVRSWNQSISLWRAPGIYGIYHRDMRVKRLKHTSVSHGVTHFWLKVYQLERC